MGNHVGLLNYAQLLLQFWKEKGRKKISFFAYNVHISVHADCSSRKLKSLDLSEIFLPFHMFNLSFNTPIILHIKLSAWIVLEIVSVEKVSWWKRCLCGVRGSMRCFKGKQKGKKKPPIKLHWSSLWLNLWSVFTGDNDHHKFVFINKVTSMVFHLL